MTDVFISYCRRNKTFIQKLHERLTNEGRDLWIDWEDIPPNADWRAEIADGIQKADTVLFALSPDWLASYECKVELEQAVQMNKRLLPIVCEEVQYKEVDPSLASLNWIFFRETDDFERAYETLRQALDTDLQHIKAHTRLLTRAIEWDKKNKDQSFLLRGKDFLEAEQWLKESSGKNPEPTPLHTDYIISSGQSQAKRQKSTIAGVAVGLVVACGLAIAAFVQYQVAETQRRRAEVLQINTLSETATATFANDDQLRGLLTSVKANRRLPMLTWISSKDDLYRDTEGTLRQLYEIIHEENRLEGHQDLITNLRVSPDRSIIASTSADNTIKLWSKEGTLLTTLSGHTSTVWSVMFSADGKTIASTGEDRTVRLWTLDGRLIKTLPFDAPVWSVSFSPTDDLLAIATADETVALVRADGTVVNRWRSVNQGKVFSIRFSPDGKQLLTGSADKIARLWDLKGNLLQTFAGHTGEIWAVRFSPDGTRVATGSADNTIRLWDLTGKTLQTFEGHDSGVISIAFSPNGQRLVSGSADHTARVWDMQGVLLHTFHHSDIVSGVDFLDDDSVVSGSYDKTVRIWWLDPELRQNLRGHTRRVLDVAISADGKTIASSSSDRTVEMWQWDGNQAQFLRSIALPSGEPNSVSLDPTGSLIAAAGFDGKIYLWNREGTLLHTLTSGTLEVYTVTISPDGQTIATGGADNTIKLWSRDGQLLRTLSGHEEGVRAIAFSPDGKTIASGSMDNTIKLWNIDGTLLRTLKGHTAAVFSVAFSPDGRTLVSGGTDNMVKLWNIDGSLLRSIRAHDSGVTSVDFSPNGQMIASGSFDNTVKLWSLDGVLIRTLVGHHQRIAAIAFSPDGNTLISGAADRLVKLWNLTEIDATPLTRAELIDESCKWLRDYLKTNSQLQTSDRNVCS
ncbi:MAG TPA: TIR domain-containing protein [Chroococcidiopsis sp.]